MWGHFLRPCALCVVGCGVVAVSQARAPHRAAALAWRGAALAGSSSTRRSAMSSARLVPALLALMLVIAAAAPPHQAALQRARRQLADDNTLQPLEGADGDEQTREKRKLEGVTQAKFGIKNAVLGFVFGKINSLIDAKTRLVDTLDRKNIELNKQYGIEAPQNGLASISGIVGQVIGPKLQLLGPKIQAVTGLIGGASGGASGGGGGQGGGGLGSLLSLVTSLSGSSSGGAAAGGTIETIDSDESDES